MRIIIISLTTFTLGLQPILATEIRWGCSTTIISNIGAVGDSRADQLSGFGAAGFNNHIQNAKKNGTAIFPPNTVLLQGLAQYGSKASEWVEKIKFCQETSKVAFDVPQYTIISLGGNDMLAYIKQKYDMKHVSDSNKIIQSYTGLFTNVYNAGKSFYQQVRKTSLKGFLRSPLKTIGNLVKSYVNFLTSPLQSITGNPLIKYPDYQTQWEWQDSTSNDRIVTDMKYVLTHFMEQSGTVKDPATGRDVIVNGSPINVPKSVMVNTVQIAAPASFGYAIAVGTKDFKWYYTNVVKQFNGLRTKYTRDLYPSLKSKYGLQIILLDTYSRYLKNVLRENSSFYFDGVHFTDGGPDPTDPTRHIEGGGEYWGRAIAIMMTYYKWLTLSEPADGGQLFVEIEIGVAAATINTKSKAAGIDPDQVDGTDVDSYSDGFSKYFEQEPITVTWQGYDFEFNNDKAFYSRNGDNHAYLVRGDVLLSYIENGGPDGELGFPLRDEITANFDSYRSSEFECGTITRNYLDLITPLKKVMDESRPECIAKKAREAN